jgi:EmrB/QacA subfamily drug resistance transporter
VDKAGRWILTTTVLGSGLAFFDGTTTGIALPRIQAEFHASLAAVQWIASAYALALAALLLFAGALGDLKGRRRVYLAGIALFVLGSVLSALAASVGQLIAFQALQGVGAAFMIPGSLAIINTTFAPSERGHAIGLWAGYSGGIAASGPFLGGWLVEQFGWPAVWWVNVPLGLAAFLLAYKIVPESRNEEARAIDWLGTLLIVAGLIGLAFGLIHIGTAGWLHPLSYGPLLAGLLALAAFGYVEARSAEPLVPLGMLGSPTVLGANLATFLIYFALSGMFLFLGLNLQQVQGLSPLHAGLATLPPILLITFLSGPAGTLADRRGARLPMILGPLLVAGGQLLLMLSGTRANYWTQILPGTVLSGAASGVNNAVSRLAALLAIAVCGLVLSLTFRGSLERRLVAIPLSAEQRAAITAQSVKAAAIELPTSLTGGLRTTTQEAVHGAFVDGFRRVVGLGALLCLLAALTSAVLIRDEKA